MKKKGKDRTEETDQIVQVTEEDDVLDKYFSIEEDDILKEYVSIEEEIMECVGGQAGCVSGIE